MSLPSVLIVDDDRVDGAILKEFLERDGRFGDIYLVQDGEDALAPYKATQDLIPGEAFPVDVIFLDLHMPKVTGFEFLEASDALSEDDRGPTKVVVLLGGIDPEQDWEKVRHFSVVAAQLPKPFDSERVDALFQELTPQ